MVVQMGRDTFATNEDAIARARLDGISLLGFYVSWSLRGVRLDREELKTRLIEEGLLDFFPARPPTAKKALKRAINEWAQSRGMASSEDGEGEGDEEVNQRRRLLREIRVPASSADDDEGGGAPVLFALVEEESLARALRLRFGTSHRFYYKPAVGGLNAGRLQVSTKASGPVALDEAREIEDELKPIWERHRTLYLAGDVSRIVTEVIEALGAIQLRDGGGVYHVDLRHSGELDKLARFIGSLPTTDRWGRVPLLSSTPVPDWPMTRATLGELAFDDLLGEIRATETGVARSEEQNEYKAGSVRPRTLQALMSEITAIKSKAEAMAERLGMRRERRERLSNSIDTLQLRAAILMPQEERRAARTTDDAQVSSLNLPDEGVRRARA